MLEYIEEMITTIWGAYFMSESPFAYDLLNVVMCVFAVLLIILTYKIWKFAIFGWWNK